MTDQNVIQLINKDDYAFSKIAQKSKVTGAILPSGLQIPEKGDWRIIDNFVVNIAYLKEKLSEQFMYNLH